MRSLIIAIVIAIAAAGWILSGQLPKDPEAPATAETAATAPSARDAGTDGHETDARVRVRRSVAEDKVTTLVLRGRTEAERRVVLRAQTLGEVAEIHAEEGRLVNAGDPLISLAEKDRPARLVEAKSAVDRRLIDYRAANKLSKKGFAASTRKAETVAELQAARAALAAIETEIAHLSVTAPFDGVLHSRTVEVGDYVQEGDEVATIVDLDPILVVVQASERDVPDLTVGKRATARLLGGESFDGTVRYVAREGDEATRTFRVEIAVPNPDRRIAANMTADVAVDLRTVRAHHVSPAVLTLDPEGAVGVKAVDPDGRVVFRPVSILDDGADGMWLSGLPEELTLITAGQEFVVAGQAVDAVPESEIPTPGRSPDGSTEPAPIADTEPGDGEATPREQISDLSSGTSGSPSPAPADGR